jgi:hypothetical protein
MIGCGLLGRAASWWLVFVRPLTTKTQRIGQRLGQPGLLMGHSVVFALRNDLLTNWNCSMVSLDTFWPSCRAGEKVH